MTTVALLRVTVVAPLAVTPLPVVCVYTPESDCATATFVVEARLVMAVAPAAAVPVVVWVAAASVRVVVAGSNVIVAPDAMAPLVVLEMVTVLPLTLCTVVPYLRPGPVRIWAAATEVEEASVIVEEPAAVTGGGTGGEVGRGV